MITRRSLLLGVTAVPFFEAALHAAAEWGSPVLDIHLHPRKEAPAIAHLEGAGVDRAVLLPGGIEGAKEIVASDPKHFVRFARADVKAPDAAKKIKADLDSGAIGLGELKYAVQVDGPEMRPLYQLAAEYKVPVLLHLEEGNFNSGIHRMPALLTAYPNTIFIGHGQSFWANISSEPGDEKSYPSGPIKPNGLTDRILADYPNMYGDLSANSGRNGLARDPAFTAAFLIRHRNKLMFGSDCPCLDGHGAGQSHSAVPNKCIARETLAILKQSASPELFRQIVWENGNRLLKLNSKS
jgi:uncharacterized protein